MKRILTIIAVIFLVISFNQSTTDAAMSKTVKITNSDTVNVLENTDTNSKILITVSKGFYVTVLSTKGEWSQVKAGKTIGYIKSSALKTKEAAVKILSVKTDVKTTASSSSTTVGTIIKNSIVEDYGVAGKGYSYVKFGNVIGYVPTKSLKATKATTQYVKTSSNVFGKISSKSAKIGSITKNQKVQVHATSGDWSYITVGSTKGYVPKIVLSKQRTIVTDAKEYLPACGKYYTYASQDKLEGTKGTNTYLCEKTDGKNRLYRSDIEIDLPGAIFGEFYIENGNLMVLGYESLSDYRFPMSVGQKWSEYAYVEDLIQYEVLSINEKVTVGAGTFNNVLKIREKYSYVQEGYGTPYGIIYIAPGAGIIKWEATYRTLELVKVKNK